MKKEYIQPQLKVRTIKSNPILAGSDQQVQSTGSTSEQCAKSARPSWGDCWDQENN